MDAIAIIKYFCAVAVGAVGSALYICNTYTLGKRRGLGSLRPLRILISGAAGHIGYALAPLIARGLMCGPDQQVILHMHDREEAAQNLAAVQMELDDLASDLLLSTKVMHNLEEACKGVDIAVLLSGLPKKSTKDFEARSKEMYSVIGRALNEHASQHVKVVIVPQPASTCAAAVCSAAPRLLPKNITVLSRLAHNRLTQQVADPLDIHASLVSNVIVWGNPTSTSVLDVLHGSIHASGGSSIPLQNCVDEELIQIISQAVMERTDVIVQARNLTPALSVAGAICDHLRDWILGTPEGTWVSMGVRSDGSYGVPEGLFFSLPVTCRSGQWDCVQGLAVSADLQLRLQACVEEARHEQQ